MDKNVVGWFEIPVADMERAIKFYETVFGFKLERHQMGPLDMAWFPQVQDGIGSMGSLVHNEEFYKPSADGTLVYFTSQAGDVNVELGRIEEAGGQIVVPRRQISEEYGYIGVFLDSEGNRIGVHSRQ